MSYPKEGALEQCFPAKLCPAAPPDSYLATARVAWLAVQGTGWLPSALILTLF